jgi:hypothetical protein
MKNLFTATIFLLALLAPVSLFALSHTPGSTTVLFSNATAAASGTVEISVPIGMQDHVYSVSMTDANASITVLTVALEGSIDGATWFIIEGSQFTLTAGELTAKQAMFHVLSRPVNFIRGKVVTLTGRGTGDVVSMRYDIGG